MTFLHSEKEEPLSLWLPWKKYTNWQYKTYQVYNYGSLLIVFLVQIQVTWKISTLIDSPAETSFW